MPGLLIQVGATLLCPHGGTITIVPAGAQATTDGAVVANTTAKGVVTGCTLATNPCTAVTWTTGAAKVILGGAPALVTTSPAAFAGSGVVGIPATVVQTQKHVVAT